MVQPRTSSGVVFMRSASLPTIASICSIALAPLAADAGASAAATWLGPLRGSASEGDPVCQ